MRQRGTTPDLRSRTPRALRLAVTVATLLAFLLQAFAVQTHIHGASTPTLTLDKTAGHDKAPAGDDESACQMCQALLHAGAYLVPVAAQLHVAHVETVAALAAAEAPLIAPFAAHGWNSRAPPRR
jgi:predicted metal-binding membrane protein